MIKYCHSLKQKNIYRSLGVLIRNLSVYGVWVSEVKDCNVKSNDISISREGALIANKLNDFMTDSAHQICQICRILITSQVIINQCFLNQC